MSANPHSDSPVQSQSNTATSQNREAKNIYCISGLGADRRVFDLLEFPHHQPIHLNWLEPQKKENITDYAQRLAREITDQNPIIIGLSFGGIVAIEIAKQIAVEKVILISSVKQKREIPLYFRLFRWLPIHRLFPFKTVLWAVYWLIYYLFSLETVAERKLLKTILIETDDKFLKWAINQVILWDNQTIPDHIHHLHGTSDRLFPIRLVEPDVVIETGGHFMIMNRAEKISQLINEFINLV